MKKVLLVLALGVSAMVLSSCFGRECVCKVKVDGDKSVKTIDYQDECEKTGDWEEEVLGVKYEYKCK